MSSSDQAALYRLNSAHSAASLTDHDGRCRNDRRGSPPTDRADGSLPRGPARCNSGDGRRSLRADAQRCGLRRIADTLDAVPFVTFCNLANINTAMRGGLLDVIEVHLMCVGAGPTLDFADAAALLADSSR